MNQLPISFNTLLSNDYLVQPRQATRKTAAKPVVAIQTLFPTSAML